MNARRRQQAGSDVQLCIAGEARADRSSVAADPGDGGRHSERDVAAICEAVCGCGAFFQRVLVLAQPYLSEEQCTVDGTRIEAWASQKSFRRKDDAGDRPGASGEVDFHGEKRGNETHQSTTDPEARLYKKSKGSEAKLSYLGHVLIENRHGLLVQTM